MSPNKLINKSSIVSKTKIIDITDLDNITVEQRSVIKQVNNSNEKDFYFNNSFMQNNKSNKKADKVIEEDSGTQKDLYLETTH